MKTIKKKYIILISTRYPKDNKNVEKKIVMYRASFIALSCVLI